MRDIKIYYTFTLETALKKSKVSRNKKQKQNTGEQREEEKKQPPLTETGIINRE